MKFNNYKQLKNRIQEDFKVSCVNSFKDYRGTTELMEFQFVFRGKKQVEKSKEFNLKGFNIVIEKCSTLFSRGKYLYEGVIFFYDYNNNKDIEIFRHPHEKASNLYKNIYLKLNEKTEKVNKNVKQ